MCKTCTSVVETRMNIFLISLSRPCMHGNGSIKVLQGVVELSTSCLGLKRDIEAPLCRG